MGTILSRILSPAVLLYTYVIVTQFAFGIYVGAQFQFPEGITLIYRIGILWVLGWWLRADRIGSDALPAYDPGFFLALAWPLVMPYYLLKTRGAKGLLIILSFAAAYGGATIIGAALSAVMVALRS